MTGATNVGAYDPANGDYRRQSSTDIRMMTWNVLSNFVTNSAVTAGPITRVLKRINPDVIGFQEIDDTVTATQLENALESILGGTWYVVRGTLGGGTRNVLASRYPFVSGTPITDTIPISDVRGITGALIDLPNATYGTTNFYAMTVHMYPGSTAGPSGTHAHRQRTADAAVNWMRDAREAGGNITLASGTPMVLMGDTNLGFNSEGDTVPYHATWTFLNGDIYDEATFGADSAPDWDGSVITEVSPVDWKSADPDTFPSTNAYPWSRLDRIYYTDSVIHTRGRFILNTASLTPAALSAFTPALLAADSANATDHLPLVADFAFGAEGPPGRVLLNEFSAEDPDGDDHSFVELINVGGQDLNLQSPLDYELVCASLLPSAVPSVPNESARYDLQGVIPPGGVYVLYNSQGDSSAISDQINSLPVWQRQDTALFSLPDDAPAGMALILNVPVDTASYIDVLVDSAGYGDQAPLGHRFIRTAATTNLIVELLADQLTPNFIVSDGLSYGRTAGFLTPSSLRGWEIPAYATPGRPNSLLSHGLFLH